jgi:hypothetical protein
LAVFLQLAVFGFHPSAEIGNLLLAGLLKPGIWFAAWYIRPDRWHPWLEPTRVSAILFGAAIGAAVTLT